MTAPRWCALALVAAGGVLAASPGAASARAAAPHRFDPVALVDPFVGTGTSTGDHSDPIDAFPGADVPFGMLQWSPDTAPRRPSGGGYAAGQHQTTGFALTHASGAGCPVYGDVPILPLAGAVPTAPAKAKALLSHEAAAPGYYRATLGGGRAQIELTVTTRSGAARMVFPGSSTGTVLFKAADSAFADEAAAVRVVGDRTIVGSASSGGFCLSPSRYTVYWAAIFDRPFAAAGTWHGLQAGGGPDLIRPSAVPVASGPTAGAWATLDTSSSRPVVMRVGLSFVSEANALANLRAEQLGADFDTLRQRARQAWQDALQRIRIKGGSRGQQVEFYTALYHSLMHPNVNSDVDGSYLGFDGAVHRTRGWTHYTNMSGWDVYRCQIPLVAALFPKVGSDTVRSLLADADEGGWLPKWPLASAYTGVMNGDAADPVIADAYAFGARHFGKRTALRAMIKGATRIGRGQGWYQERPDLPLYAQLGYVPTAGGNPQGAEAYGTTAAYWGTSETMEYAVADFAISRIAAAVGNQAAERQFLARSQSWQHVFDPTFGEVQAKAPDATFPDDPTASTPVIPTFGQSGFEEGTASQYTWMVPHDLAGLAAAMGGRRQAVRRLDRLFTKLNEGADSTYYWAGNEPGFATPFVYDHIGAPWRTQDTVRRIVSTLYRPTPGGEPGNDDLGAQSSWFVWAALGLYPTVPGTADLDLTTPLFPFARIKLGSDHTWTIRAPGASAHRYIAGMRIAERPWSRPWLPAAFQQRDITVDVTTAARPNHDWGTDPDVAPPSFRTGELPAIGFTAPSGMLSAGVGKPARLVVGAQNVTDTRLPVTATVSASPGLVVDRTTVQFDAAPAGRPAARPATVVRATGLAPGLYYLRIAFSTRRGRLDDVTVRVVVS